MIIKCEIYDSIIATPKSIEIVLPFTTFAIFCRKPVDGLICVSSPLSPMNIGNPNAKDHPICVISPRVYTIHSYQLRLYQSTRSTLPECPTTC